MENKNWKFVRDDDERFCDLEQIEIDYKRMMYELGWQVEIKECKDIWVIATIDTEQVLDIEYYDSYVEMMSELWNELLEYGFYDDDKKELLKMHKLICELNLKNENEKQNLEV